MQEIQVTTHAHGDTEGITVVTINRPEKRNCCTLAMWQGLESTFQRLSDDPAVRVVILTGAGGHYCAGADISEFPKVRHDVESGKVYEAAVKGAYSVLSKMPKPTISAVSGNAVGGGCGFAVSTDFRIADRTARFGIPAARLGIVYSPSDTQHLIEVVGFVNAKRVLFSGRIFEFEDAKELGFIDAVAEGDVLEEAIAFGASLAENAPISIAGAKLIAQAVFDGAVAERRAEIDAILKRSIESEDYREAAKAFVEKRKPQFKGQ